MKIINATASPGFTGFFFDDQQAIKNGATSDGANYIGDVITEGFTAIRQAGEAISIILMLEDGQMAYGDCAAVQYSGAGGRDPLFLAQTFIPLLNELIFPKLIGQELTSFKTLAASIDDLQIDGKNLHTALRYGISQALLDAVAKANQKMMCEIIADEYELNLTADEVPLFMQSGDLRYDNADKMIIKKAHVLPHALINHVDTKLGKHGELLEKYVDWLKNRILKFRQNDDYQPVLHIDVYGTIGQIFGIDNYDKIVAYLSKLAKLAAPFKLRIEGPVDTGQRQSQITALAIITKMIDEAKINVEIVADEWCNTLEDIQDFADAKAGHMIQIKTPDLGSIHHTVEAVLYCKAKGIGAYQGGTCNETDRSARVCVQVAMATKPDQILAKPGMGVDEGLMICHNEMQRIRAMLQLKGVTKQ